MPSFFFLMPQKGWDQEIWVLVSWLSPETKIDEYS